MPNGPLHPASIIQAFQQGGEKAFDFFFRKYYSALCFFAHRYVNDTELARDLVQECFIKLWEKHQTINNPGAIKSFLYTSVRNQSIDHLRRQKTAAARMAGIFQIEEQWEASPINEVIHAETLRNVHEAINQLPDRMQQVFKRYYLEHKKLEEIAAELHITPRTARNHKDKALIFLRKKLNLLLLIFLAFL